MRLSRNELLVIINPYAALDHNGMPVGVVLHDPLEGRAGEAHFIGARIARTEVRRTDVQPKRGTIRADRRKPRYATRVDHDMAQQSVPHTAHHIAAIESGALIPANEATARIARVSFVDPAARLATARENAIDAWTREHGDAPPVADWPPLTIPGSAAPGVPAAPAPATNPTPGPTTASSPAPPAAAAPAPASPAPTQPAAPGSASSQEGKPASAATSDGAQSHDGEPTVPAPASAATPPPANEGVPAAEVAEPPHG
jgi:hypothetical protein